MRVSDLDGARESYASALPIYREIRDRLGEANCLKSLGQLELASGRPGEAFSSFLGVLERYREIHDRLGEQAALGYLAQAAHAAGQLDQALILAEQSFDVGREVQDRFGQTINLDLQVSVWLQAENHVPALAAMVLYRDLAQQIRDQARIQRYAEILDQTLPTLPDDLRKALEESPEDVRRMAIREAEERLQAEGRDPFTSPSEND